jgi:tetratricopeptide (TPR) repeat protein
MAANNAQVLPQKEGAVFKTIVKFYETKQYKKGLKAADSILKKFPDHGETLAMKGLTLNCLERKQEAYEHVRLGLKKNLMSHVCWHVYGLLYRSDRDYKEAIKCYKQALKRDKDNTQILRDLSLLQIQMRELQGFAETRRQLLTLNSKNRNTWIGFAVATHVAGDLPMAMTILQAYEGTLEEVRTPDYEHSEMLMYKAQLLEEIGDLEGCLTHLDTSEPLVLDRMALREKRGSLLLRLGRKEQAEKQYRALLAINSDNVAYHEGLLAARGYGSDIAAVSGEKEAELEEVYAALAKDDPRCLGHKRMPLDFLTGDRFKAAFARYVPPYLRKGIPSLFSDLKPLYKSPAKAAAIEEVMLANLASLEAGQTLPGSDAIEPPVTILWVLEFLANHFDKRGDPVRALELADRALAYTPTVIDLHLTKARIYKHAGDFAKASDECEIARKMDLADRCTARAQEVSASHFLLGPFCPVRLRHVGAGGFGC